MRWLAIGLLGAIAVLAQSGRSYSAGHPWWSAGDGSILPWEETFDNPDGMLGVFNKQGAVHTSGHAFFERLGSNGRACVTCHQPSDAMSLSVASLRARWEETAGSDPVFAAIDGSNCPDLPQASRASHSLLLDRGLIRIFLPKPVSADFKIEVVRDPTGCNKDNSTISVYRRPRVAANFRYAPDGGFMADGREPSLRTQALTAVMVHEQAVAAPSPEQLRQILDFESQVYIAQSTDVRGGRLSELLGAENLSKGVATRVSFDPWRSPSTDNLPDEFRASVARGSDLFFNRTFRLAGSAGTCATCHNAPALNWTEIGTTNVTLEHAAPDLPLFRVTCRAGARVIYTQDPGHALITGKCADVGFIAAHQLRGLAARAPYFTNGSAKTIGEVVDLHDRRFSLRFTDRERQDLINFLTAL